MTIRFCDTDPCPHLQRAFEILLISDLAGEQFEVIVTPNQGQLPPQRVSFEYCPFCGTRIDPEWVEAAKHKGS